MARLGLIVFAGSFLLAGCASRCVIKPPEQAALYPATASYDPSEKEWTVPVHGRIYEPVQGPLARSALLLIRTALLIPPSVDASLFEERARHFLVQAPGRRSVWVKMGEKFYPVDRTAADGHFAGVIRLSEAEARALGSEDEKSAYRVLSCERDARPAEGRVRFLPEAGISVISDVDHTIRMSKTGGRMAELMGLLFQEHEPVAGMPDLYRSWEDAGLSFHYVSAAPWQLYQPLAGFVERAGYPPGDFYLQRWGGEGKGVLDRIESLAAVLESEREHKTREIVGLFERYPGRRFVLVGDTAGPDPETYGSLARRYPDRVAKIFLRNVADEAPDRIRIDKALEGVSPETWRLFSGPAELADERFFLDIKSTYID